MSDDREPFLESLLDTIPIPVFYKDRQGRYLGVNKAFEDFFGSTKAHMVGASVLDIAPGELAETCHASDEALFEQGGIQRYESRVMNARGELREVVFNKAVFTDRQGAPTGLIGAIEDVTERKRLEDELAERERDFHSLAENLPDNIARWDTDGRYLYINPTHEHLLGKPRDALIGTSIPDSHASVKAAIAQVVASGQAIRSVRESAPVDGVVQTHEVSLVPEFDENGKVVSVLGLGRDMTDLYRMQAELAAREHEFRNLAESSPDHIIRLGRDGRVRYVNDALVSHLGLASAEDAIGRSPAEVWPDGRYEQVERAAAQAVDTGAVTSVELVRPDASGESRFHEVRIVPERDTTGRIVGTIGFGRDITAIRTAERRLEHVIDSLPGLAYSFRLSPDGRVRFTFASGAVREIYGVEPDEVMSSATPLHLLAHPEDRPRIEAAIAESARTMTPFRVETRVCRSGLRERWLESRSAPERGADGSIVWYGLMLDVTARKRVERTLRFVADPSGEPDFLAALARHLGETLGVAYVVVDRLAEEPGVAETVALFANGAILPNMRYALADTPCDNVLGKRTCCYSSGVQALFPKDAMLAEMGVDSYAGVPLWDSTGRPIGLIAVMDGAPLSDKAMVTQIVQLVAPRAAAELERARSDAEVRAALDDLRHKEHGLAEAQRLGGIGSWEFDLLTGTLSWSDEVFRIYELDPAHFGASYEAFLAAIHPDDRDTVDAAYTRSLQERTPYAIDHRLQMPDGRIKYVHDRCETDFDDAGKPLRSRGTVQDITERKAAETGLQAQFEQILRLNERLEETARSLEEQAVELEASQEQLASTEAWYRGILHSAPDGMLVVSERGIVALANAQLLRMFGYFEGELIGRPIGVLIPPETSGQDKGKGIDFALGAAGDRHSLSLGEMLGRCKDGRELAIEVSLSRLPDAESARSICVAVRDITERKRLQAELAEREREYRTLVENTPDTVARYGPGLRRLYVNPAFAALVEGGATALLGKTPSESPGGPNAALYERQLGEVFASGTVREFELKWTNKSDGESCSLISLTPEFDADGAVESVLAVGRDITELNASRQKIHQMAFYDPLTALPNRALFADRLRQMIADASRHGQSAGLMIIDMDRFKAVNDTMGHAVGDELLCETALRLSACVRGYDTVARLGGDEFAILLPEIRHGDDLGRIANKVLAKFDERFLLDGKEVFVTCSIGIALYPDDSTDADDLVKYADSAMYLAKRSGRNNFRFYSKDLTVSANERLTLESELRRAVERHELELHYQPKVLLQDGTMVGSEALLRWRHPQRGMIPPSQFIQIAEDTGLIVDLGRWVLRQACRTASEWNAEGGPLHKVAINLSARQFQSQDLAATVAEILAETACRPEWIELEITESLLLDEDGKTLDTLSAFRSQGITIAIDDFGTGYSALSYLARFPIDTLKIDRSFIHSVATDEYRAELVRAILSIARCLGQQVVAEGVETLEQAAFLEANGCQVAQGFLYSKPVPKSEIALLPRHLGQGGREAAGPAG